MAGTLPVLKILQATKNVSADDALLEGLAKAEPAYQPPIVEALFARGSTTALMGLVSRFHTFDAKTQNVVLDKSEMLFPVLRRCVKSREHGSRINALEIIRRTGSYRLAYLLSLSLHDPSEDLRQRAAEILRELSDRYFRQERITLEVLSSGPFSGAEQATVQAFSLARLAEERSYLISAITEAVNNYDIHRRREVAEVVVWFSRHISGTLWRAIANRLHGCGRAVASLIEKTNDPRTVPFMYQALGHRDLRPVIARIVSMQHNDYFMREFVRWSFLVPDPPIRRGLAAIRSLTWLGRGTSSVLDLEPTLYFRAVELILATSVTIERKVATCRDLLLASPRQAQRAGLWGLVEIEHEMSTQLIRTVVHWEDPELSAIAVREMMRRAPEDMPAVFAQKVSSDSEAIREMASRRVSEYGFQQYWQSFDMLSDEDRLQLGRALVGAGQDFLPELRAKMASSKAKDRQRAVQIIAALDIAGELEEEVYRIAYDPDTFVRSSVMALLGQLPGPTAERILLNGLNDPDDRVQANAIESLERFRATDRYNLIRERLDSEDNRVRANAVKALLSIQSPEAGAILMEMLDHEQANQRLSALWVVEAMHLMALSAKVLQIAKNDPDSAVRHRALRAVSVLTQAVRGDKDRKKGAKQTPREVSSWHG